MFRLLAAAVVGAAVALGAMSGDASAASKKYWDDGWTGGKPGVDGKHVAKIRFLKGVAPSDWRRTGPFGDRDGIYTGERKGKSFVARFNAFRLYRDDGLKEGVKPKLVGFDIVGGIKSIVPYYDNGKLYYAAVLQKGFRKGYAVVRWQVGKKLYTSALRIVASPNGDDKGGKIWDKKDDVKKVVNGGSDSCFSSPLSKIGATPKSSCLN